MKIRTFDREARIAASIREARAESGLSQAEVVERMAAIGFEMWHLPTISNIERHARKVTALELVGLSLVLGCSPARLVDPATLVEMRQALTRLEEGLLGRRTG